MKKTLAIGILICVMIVASVSGIQDPFNIPPSADSYINQQNPSTNYGGSVNIGVYSLSPSIERVVIKFDLSTIPSNAVVDSAAIFMYLNNAPSTTISRTYDAHKITSPDWTEAGVTWNSNLGIASSPTGTTLTTKTKGWALWYVTSDISSMKSGNNYGWEIKDRSENSADNFEGLFNSKEASTNKPYLRVFYTCNSGWSGTNCDQTICGDGIKVGTEECDPGAKVPGDCCNDNCQFESSYYTCRDSAGVCDAQELCTGSSGECPADVIRPSSFTCRPSAGACDLADNCDGIHTDCPADVKSTAQCRAANGDCDVAESCNGIDNNCPTDQFKPAETQCRAATGDCDAAESCTGTNGACPADSVQPSSYICRASVGACDLAEKCDGSTKTCPATDVKFHGECRPAVDQCDIQENCDGVSNDCPTDQFRSTETVCRSAAGDCDVAERCTGTSGYCSTNGFKSSGTACGDQTDTTCNKPDTCDGSGACNSNILPPNSNPEICNGVDDNCNVLVDDGYVSLPTTCGIGACAATGTTSCVAGGVVDSCTPGTPTAEVCDNVDNDCNGVTDDGDVCNPVACFTLNPGSAAAGQPVTFDASCSHAAPDDAGIVRYEWNFDLPTENPANFQMEAQGRTVNHAYAMGMEATPALKVTDSHNRVAFAFKKITITCLDSDGDGYANDACGGTDCDDADAAIHPGATEVCNGVDDNCNVLVDEDYVSLPTTCGIGACTATGTTSCVASSVLDTHTVSSSGPVAIPDNLPRGVTNTINVPDFGIAQGIIISVDISNSNINELTVLLTDPNGVVYTLHQRSGSSNRLVTSYPEPTPTVSGNLNTWAGQNPQGNWVLKVVDGYYDTNTVDGQINSWSVSVVTVVGNEFNIKDSCTPGAPAANDATCDGIDDDCNGLADEDYVPTLTTCGVGVCAATGQKTCVGGSEVDSCIEGTPTGRDDNCNGIDENCDGQFDEYYVSLPTTCGIGACAATGTTSCVAGGVVDSCTPKIPTGDDSNCNGIDDNCDGTADNNYVPDNTCFKPGACAAGNVASSCSNGLETLCTRGPASGSDFDCNGIDDDCDGLIDEHYVPTPTTCGIGACARTGTTSCVSGQVIDSCTPGLPSAEVCDHADNDCNGLIDDGLTRGTTCGTGACGGIGTETCSAGAWTGNTCTPLPQGTSCGTDHEGTALRCLGQQPQKEWHTFSCSAQGTCEDNSGWHNIGPACSGATPVCSNGNCMPSNDGSVTVKLLDSNGNGISGGVVQYYSGGWKSFGTTGSDGTVSKVLPPGTYSFGIDYANGRNEKSQNVAINPVVVFQTKNVVVQLKNSVGDLIDSGSVQYYSGGWRDMGTTSSGQVTKELLPNTYTFSMNYAYGRNEKSQNIAANPTVTFQTTNVVVQLKNSAGTPIDTGTVQYYSGGWRDMGSTSGGQVAKELLPNTYTFSMNYAFGRNEKSQNIGTDPTVIFQTKNVAVQLKNSADTLIDSGTVQYYSGGWRDMGTTSNGQVTKELLPNTYTFSMNYAFGRNEKSQNIASDATVVFQTKSVVVQLKNSAGSLIDAGSVQYYAGGWRDMGATSGGQITKELLPNTYTFSMNYAYGRNEKSQNIGTDPTVVFQTKSVVVQLKNSAGNLIDTGTVQYYAGGWRDMGATSGGQVAKELLPNTYTFSMNYAYGRNEKSQNIASDPTVMFQTKNIMVSLQTCSGPGLSGGNVQYYSGGWRTFGTTDSSGTVNMELLPNTYSFGMNYAFGRNEKSQDVNANQNVAFTTTTVSSAYSGSIQYYSGGWRTFTKPSTYMLPNTYTFSFDKTQKSIPISGCSMDIAP